MNKLFHFLILFLTITQYITSYEDDQMQMFKDLMIVDYWNKRLNERMPVTYNHFLQGGYLIMPSARMGCEGEVGVGYSSVPPYRIYNLRCQLIDRLELTGNYRIFRGIDDPILSPMGFGDLSDKGANFKFSLFSSEASGYTVPGVSIGFDDIIGTRNFRSSYIVATQVFLNYDTEISLGYGLHRIRGLFGGIAWVPFRRSCSPYLQGISLVAEYDATPYKSCRIEKHPKGHVKKTPINLGIKYRLWDTFDFTASYVRGTAFAWSASAYYNFGMTKGFLPKIDDPLPYRAPINTEPIGTLRPEDVMVQDFLFAMREQGFELIKMTLTYTDDCQKELRMHIVNDVYWIEREVRNRIDYLLAYLTPSDIDRVIVVIESEGFPVQEYRYSMAFVREFATKQIGPHELHVLNPLCEVSYPCPYSTQCLFKKPRDWCGFEFFPRVHTLFGSSRGKFKYALGIETAFTGYLYDDLLYSIRFGYTFISNMGHVTGTDRLNPSQLPIVRSDIVNYYKRRGFSLDEAYLQKNWNLGKGWFSRVSAGYFEIEYAGIATEFLYYPLHSRWAFSIEGAGFLKRKETGIGLTSKVKQLHGFVPSYHKYNFSQYFLSAYYEWCEAKIDFRLTGGKFLANDYGVQFELARYFPSGLRIAFWYTVTNGNDKINGHTYFDKGISFSMPLDVFYTYSSCSRWGYGMSAWLRDVGVIGSNGQGLYELIREQRNN